MELTAASRLTIRPLREPFGFSRAHCQESGAAVLNIRDQRAGLRAADIQGDEIALFLPH